MSVSEKEREQGRERPDPAPSPLPAILWLDVVDLCGIVPVSGLMISARGAVFGRIESGTGSRVRRGHVLQRKGVSGFGCRRWR